MIPGVVVTVAVRLKSSRLPRKGLADLAGKPLILRLQERLLGAKTPESIVWCTSTAAGDDPLEVIARENNIPIFRGDELDVMSRFLAVARERKAHTVVRVTGDNPLTDPEALDQMVEEHLANKAEYTHISENGLPRGTRPEIMATSALERCHALVEDPMASEYMTLMLKRPDHFRIHVVTPPDKSVNRGDLRLTIDTPQDLAVMQAIYTHFNGKPPRLAQVIAWLEANPGVRNLNSDVKGESLPADINVRLKGDPRA